MKLNEKTVLKMAQKGELPGVKIGSQWRFHLDSIDRYLQKDIMKVPENELDSLLSTANTITPLSRLFDERLIELNLQSLDKKGVLAELAGKAAEYGISGNGKKLLRELLNREQMLSTAVGNGIAMPHPRKPVPDLFSKPNIFLARSVNGVEFDAPDGRKARLFFMICAPNMISHLRLMAQVSRLLHVNGVIDKFLAAANKKQIIQLLLELERKDFFPWEVI
jgi:PTS system nitrogen regulatory IIA component